MTNQQRKIQGVERNQSFDNQTLTNVEFSAVTFEDCTFTNTSFDKCSASFLVFDRCTIASPRFTSCHDYEYVSLKNSTLSDCTTPIRALSLNRIENSNLRGIDIRGKQLFENSSFQLVNTTLEGSLSNLTMTENQQHDQLAGCDLTHCTITNVRFWGIPTERCQLPNSVKSAVCENWAEIADDVFHASEQVLANSESTDPEKVAANFIMAQVQLDADNFRSRHDLTRYDPSSLNLPPERGGRLINELLETNIPPEVAAAIKGFYRPWLR